MKSVFQRVNELEERVLFLERALSELKQKEAFDRDADRAFTPAQTMGGMPAHDLSGMPAHDMPQVQTQRGPYDLKMDEFSTNGGFNYVGEFSQGNQAAASQRMAQNAVSRHELDLSPKDDVRSQLDYKKTLKQRASKTKYDETLVGKYIAGALASLLIFIGAASFVAMIWNQISDYIKFGILLGSGLLISAAGYYMFLKSPFEKNANSSIASVVFSTGAGLVYIAILSSSIALGLFSPLISSVMCLIWSLVLMFSYRFTNRFICIAIGYIGAFINLILGANYIQVFADVLFLFFFITSVNLFMLYVTQKKRDKEFQLCILLAGLLYMGFLYVTRNIYFDDKITEIGTLIILLGLKNLTFYLTNAKLQANNTAVDYFRLRNRVVLVQLLFAIGFVFSFFLCEWVFRMKDFQAALLLLAVFGGQFLVNEYFYKHTHVALNGIYTLVAYYAMIGLTGDLTETYSGGIILVMFIASKLLWKNDYNLRFVLLVLLIDSILVLYQGYPIMLVYCAINMALFAYFSKDKADQREIVSTFLGLVILYLSAQSVAKGLMFHFEHVDYFHELEYRYVIAHALSVVFFILSLKLGVIPHQKSGEDSGLSVLKYQVKYDNFLLHIFLFLLYIEGLVRLQDVSLVGIKFFLTLSTLTVMLIQSYFMFGQDKRLSNIEGAWIVIKYLLFTWAVMRSFLELPVESLAYSIAGLVIAVISIYLGFYLRVKSIRQFGLAITILMVVKYIFVDLSGENSITRVIAFVIGGVLCFVVSVIYNRLSVQKRGSDEEDQGV